MLLYYSLMFYLGLSNADSLFARDDAPLDPCTIRSPTTHSFYDLNPLHIVPPSGDSKKLSSKKGIARDHSWNATGYDVGYNFTMNFCGPVVEDLKDVVGVEEAMWKNVSAFYRQGGKVYSIGQQNSVPVFRGRKMVLNYTGGSPCDREDEKRLLRLGHNLGRRLWNDDDDDDDDDKDDKDDDHHESDDDDDDNNDDKDDDKKHKDHHSRPSDSIRRKSTIISLLCDKDPLASTLTLSYVDSSADRCTYVFEARSPAACAGIEVAKQTLSPSGVFGVIMLIAVIVYVVGGCFYNRIVQNQRGWRQLPNYALWAGVFGFFYDMVIILTSSCARCLPGRKGYSRVNSDMNGHGRGRARGDSDAENRLIDDLNEEWED